MKTNMQFKSLIVLAALCAVLSSFSTMPGTHSFQVYLDGKMLVDQYASNKMIAPKVIIDPSENHTQVMVKYNECGRTVTGRALTIKDDKDNVLKEWKFEGETSGFKDGMTCNVKDILALKQKNNNSLKLYYSSTDFKEGQHVATLILGAKTAMN